MNKTLLGLCLVVFGTLPTHANAERLIDKQEYFDGLKSSCSIQVDKDLVMKINVNCTPAGIGNCSGNTWEGTFACSTTAGASKVGVNGVQNSINWILNHLSSN